MSNVVNLTVPVTNLGATVFYLLEDAPPTPAFGLAAELMPIAAPTASNTTVIAVTSSASAQQSVPGGAHVIDVSCTQAFYIIFAAPSAVPTPSAANAVLLNASTLYQIKTSNGANAFKVVRATADGVLTWTLDS